MILVASQIVGLAAVGLYLISFQLEKRRQIVWVTCISNGLYVLQYLMLGAFSGALMDFLSTVASFFAGKKSSPSLRPYVKIIAAVSIAVITVAGTAVAVVRQNPVELLAVAGAIFQTVGLWYEKEQTIRKFGLCSAPFWLAYNFISQAYGAALGSVLAMASVIISMVRYREKKA